MNIYFSIWHDAKEHTPEKSGYYLAFRGFGMSGPRDGENEYEVLYYDAKDKHWRDYESRGLWSDQIPFVYYWTDAKPNEWADKKQKVNKSSAKKSSKNPALDAAYNDVIKAFERYKIIKALV